MRKYFSTRIPVFLSLVSCQIFINKVQLICGQPKLMANKAAEHLWVTKHEIREYLGDEMGVYLNHVI